MYCGDECDCWVPVINEVKDGEAKEIWRGTFLEKPSEQQKAKLRGELEAARVKFGSCTILEDVRFNPSAGTSGQDAVPNGEHPDSAREGVASDKANEW